MPKGIHIPIICGKKQCQSCKVSKPVAEFYGNHGHCKECQKLASKERYHKDGSAGKTNNNRRLEARLALKRQLVDAAGGCCVHCGYNKSLHALDFHHTGKDKEHALSDILLKASGKNGSYLAIALAEAAKCVLLCANCHRELHAGEWEL